MTLAGMIARLSKYVFDKRPSTSEVGGGVSSSVKLDLPDSRIVIEGFNDSGETIEQFSLVVFRDGPTALDMPSVYYPGESSDDEDAELTQFGVTLERAENGEVCHVQIAGTAIVRFAIGSVPTIIGETVYPIKYDVEGGDLKGMVGNAESGESDLMMDSPIGKVLHQETSDQRLALINLNVNSAGGTGNLTAKYATTSSLGATLIGAETPDGATPADPDDYVLVKDQSDKTLNGLYKAAAGTWTRVGGMEPGVLISIRAGNTNAYSVWQLVTEGPIEIGVTELDFRKVNTDNTADRATTNAITPSGSVSVDGGTPSTGQIVLVKSNSGGASLANIGLFRVNTAGAWQNLGQPDYAFIRTGTINKLTVWIKSATNVYERWLADSSLLLAKAAVGNSAPSGATIDGITIVTGDRVLRTAGTGVGTYLYDGSTYIFEGLPLGVLVCQGAAYGRRMWCYDGSATYFKTRGTYS